MGGENSKFELQSKSNSIKIESYFPKLGRCLPIILFLPVIINDYFLGRNYA